MHGHDYTRNERQLERDQGEVQTELTDDDLTFVEGKEDELFGRLQKRLGKNKEELRREIEEF